MSKAKRSPSDIEIRTAARNRCEKLKILPKEELLKFCREQLILDGHLQRALIEAVNMARVVCIVPKRGTGATASKTPPHR